MKQLPLERRGLPASRLILGCMGLGGARDRNPVTDEDVQLAHKAVEAALETGIRMFDHADIYKLGKAEVAFGRMLKEKPGLREQIIVQSKIGIRAKELSGLPFKRYDFSREHILAGVDGILKRLGTEYLDVLLLHRPDPLMDAEEVAESLRQLKTAGKVRWFGVSNMHAGQIELLAAYCDEPLVVNQLGMSLAQLAWLDSGVTVNQSAAGAHPFPLGTLEYCQRTGIQLQAWAPLAQGLFSGAPLDGQDERTRRTAKLVSELAESKRTAPEAIVLAWLLKHPAAIQPVLGTTRAERIRACGEALSVSLTSDEWYTLYVSARGAEMP